MEGCCRLLVSTPSCVDTATVCKCQLNTAKWHASRGAGMLAAAGCLALQCGHPALGWSCNKPPGRTRTLTHAGGVELSQPVRVAACLVPIQNEIGCPDERVVPPAQQLAHLRHNASSQQASRRAALAGESGAAARLEQRLSGNSIARCDAAFRPGSDNKSQSTNVAASRLHAPGAALPARCSAAAATWALRHHHTYTCSTPGAGAEHATFAQTQAVQLLRCANFLWVELTDLTVEGKLATGWLQASSRANQRMQRARAYVSPVWGVHRTPAASPRSQLARNARPHPAYTQLLPAALNVLPPCRPSSLLTSSPLPTTRQPPARLDCTTYPPRSPRSAEQRGGQPALRRHLVDHHNGLVVDHKHPHLPLHDPRQEALIHKQPALACVRAQGKEGTSSSRCALESKQDASPLACMVWGCWKAQQKVWARPPGPYRQCARMSPIQRAHTSVGPQVREQQNPSHGSCKQNSKGHHARAAMPPFVHPTTTAGPCVRRQPPSPAHLQGTAGTSA